MGVTLAVYASAGLAILSFDFPPPWAVLATAADAAVLWAGTALLLQFFKHPRRTTQTVTALAGTGLVISLLALPIAFWLTYGHAHDMDVAVPSLLWFLLFGWSVFVTARIFQQALSTTFTTALLVAMAFIFIDQQIINLFLPKIAA